MLPSVPGSEYHLRRSGAVALVLFCAVFGIWLGEGPAPFRQALPLATGAIGGLAAALVFPGRSSTKLLAGFASLAMYAAAFTVGSQSFGRAFEECIHRGDEIRVLLREYHSRYNAYPESLSEVLEDGFCGRMLRPTILEYQRTGEGYRLSFRDWLVEHTATESESFMARK